MDYFGITIEDTYCECTDLYIARVLLTAATADVAMHEATYLCGWSIITSTAIQGCVEGAVPGEKTPDGRPGVLIQLNAPVPVGLEMFRTAVLERLYILPHLPSCSVFDATPPEGEIVTMIDCAAFVGRWGDSYEHPERVGDRNTLCIPIMTGDQYIETQVGVCVGMDGVLEVFTDTVESCLLGAQLAVHRIVGEPAGVGVFNYPVGGISGAKVGGNTYLREGVTINEPFCPTLRDVVETSIPDGANVTIEFPLVAISEPAIRAGLKTAIDAFADTQGVRAITAPNFGGAWGGLKVMLRDVLKVPR